MKLSGIFPPMITPFKENGEVDYEAFVYNVRKWAQTDLEGLLVLGSNSETAFLREEEKLKLVKLAAANAPGKIIMCGTGMETAEELSLIHICLSGRRLPYMWRKMVRL